MQFVAILLASTLVAWLLGRRTGGWHDHARRGLGAAMIVAGVSHFVRTEPFVQHLPDWVPSREALVVITGAVEIAFGAALFVWRRHRPTVGRLLAAYLVGVLPANVYVAANDIDVDGQAGGAMAWIRLPLQALFIAWALVSTSTDRDRTQRPAIESSIDSAHRLAAP